jgi:dipeptide/tripeptide permease
LLTALTPAVGAAVLGVAWRLSQQSKKAHEEQSKIACMWMLPVVAVTGVQQVLLVPCGLQATARCLLTTAAAPQMGTYTVV